MKFLRNAGTERTLDLIKPLLKQGSSMDIATSSLSLFAFAELFNELSSIQKTRLLLPSEVHDLDMFGTAHDRAARNRLQMRWLALRLAQWIQSKVELRRVNGVVPQGAAVLRDASGNSQLAIVGSFSFSTDGLGITPGNPLNLIQASESAEESRLLSQWFDAQWNTLKEQPEAQATLLAKLKSISDHRDPYSIYVLMLHHLFQSSGDEMDEERIVNSATGIRNTLVWKKLYKFQRDGVVGAIDKLNRFGGCIIADSVGLGKTFEALAIIKYHELRNDRVLVLCPKRLRDNWTLYKTNDKRNTLPDSVIAHGTR
uniref:Helicase domain-containing protein n=1 Tax=Candidatus Nitrotoga fabula TaxID=2182327 RepID=A0A2X0RED0_9PROT